MKLITNKMQKKKAALIGLAIIAICTLMIGCNDANAKTDKLNYREIGDLDIRTKIYIYVDPETGVQYIVFDKAAHNIFVTPRLNADRTLMTSK